MSEPTLTEVARKLDLVLKRLDTAPAKSDEVRLISIYEAAIIYRIGRRTIIEEYIDRGRLRVAKRRGRVGKAAIYLDVDECARVLGAQ